MAENQSGGVEGSRASQSEKVNVKDTDNLISDYNEYFVTCVATYRKVNSEIKKKKADLVEQLSQVSSSNGSSKASSKRAKAEAEKVRLEFVRKEGELMKQKAAIEADINIVKQESKVAAAETEVRILEQGDQEQDIISEVCEKKDDISNYVHNVHFQEPVASWLNQQPNIPVVASSASQAFSAAVSVPQIPSIVNTVLTSVPQIPSVVNTVFTSLSSQPNIQPSLSQYPVQTNATSTNSLLHDAMTDITRFMYRKDFLLSRFTNFDDKPEAYESWRASFQSVTRELGVTPPLKKWIYWSNGWVQNLPNLQKSSVLLMLMIRLEVYKEYMIVYKKDTRLDVSSESSVRCPLHKAGHTLNDCRGFRKYPIQDRQKFLREKRICFKCCETNEHFASNCTVNVKCAVCGNKRHATAMHIDRYTQNRTQADNEKPLTADGGEHSETM
ncbi:unnamed protein product [Mytilus edulis]|uniref:CCHC-type domain-containing protein n=1 Tax=Mytilus edulis TaxID=6550 RepID=A0A8S3RBP6_MYTED|nr:unnamed protein product [Mytilus edulis]